MGAAIAGAPSVALAGCVLWASTAPNFNGAGGRGGAHAPRRFPAWPGVGAAAAVPAVGRNGAAIHRGYNVVAARAAKGYPWP